MRRLLLLIAVLALVAPACSAGDEEIAWVGGETIRLSDIGALFEGDTLPLDDVFLDTLFRVMAVKALHQALAADFGGTVPAEVYDGYLSQLETARAEQGVSPAQFLGVPNASLAMVEFNAEVLALRDATIEHLMVAPTTVDMLFADPATLTTVCAKHILVETLEESEAAKARLEAGEDFATVAGEVSTDTSSEGGDLGCALAGGYVEAFAQAVVEAPLGEVFGPVETDFGFHLLVVSERTTPTREDYLAAPEEYLADEEVGSLWTQWFNEILQTVDARVAEKYGTWTSIGIKAPETSTTTTSSAG